jgi:hypothetical protein
MRLRLQRSQNPDTMWDSEVPSSPAWVSHADNAMKEVSFISTIYRGLRGRPDAELLESVRCLFLADFVVKVGDFTRGAPAGAS